MNGEREEEEEEEEEGEEDREEDEFDSTANIPDDIQNPLQNLKMNASDTISVNLLQQTLNQDNYNEIKNACAIKIVSLTKEYNDFLKLCESSMNPVGQKLRERSAAKTSLARLKHRSEPIRMRPWIEVLHDDLESSKIDGLARNSMIILIELAGGYRTNKEKKLESDFFRTYKNAIKTLKKDNKRRLQFFVTYYKTPETSNLSLPSWRQAAIDLAE
ncbi:hypothetical protein INT47_004255 [Mucor saturninus]|uniref:Uncharacterized protein n=1 Tax=Mucor saturninus TaxID=64648 RepID=A0A8H7RC01_9FUNG|nr:hypothetical protein INT47_004255 [Mucor saturninus]